MHEKRVHTEAIFIIRRKVSLAFACRQNRVAHLARWRGSGFIGENKPPTEIGLFLEGLEARLSENLQALGCSGAARAPAFFHAKGGAVSISTRKDAAQPQTRSTWACWTQVACLNLLFRRVFENKFIHSAATESHAG